MVIQSMGFNPVTCSSSWQELSSNFISILSRFDASMCKSFCKKSKEQTAGTQRPKVNAVPFFGLKKSQFYLKSIGGQSKILKFTYCCTKNGATRGLVKWASPICHTFRTTLSTALYWYDFGDEIPFKSKTTCPIQYFVWYSSVFRWMWKHSENEPNS